MYKLKFTLGYSLIQIALAIIFIVTGLALLGNGSFFQRNEIQSAVSQIFTGDMRKFVTIGIGVVLMACGIMQIAGIVLKKSALTSLLKLVTLIVWICVAVIVDVLGGIKLDTAWFTKIAYDMLIIGGLLLDTSI